MRMYLSSSAARSALRLRIRMRQRPRVPLVAPAGDGDAPGDAQRPDRLAVTFLGRQAEGGTLAVDARPGLVLALDVAQSVAPDGLGRQAALSQVAEDGGRLHEAGVGLRSQFGGLRRPCLRRRRIGRRRPRVRAAARQRAEGAILAPFFPGTLGEVNPQLLARLPERQPSGPHQQLDGVAARLAMSRAGPGAHDAVLHGDGAARLLGKDAEAVLAPALGARGRVFSRHNGRLAS